MHLDEEQLQRLLHGEPLADGGGAAREHLARCGECHRRMAIARRDESEIFGLLRLVDHRPPAVQAEAVVARARRSQLGWGRWAAGILLLLGAAGAAYAVPGSPVRGWIRSAATWIGREAPATSVPSQVETPPEPAAGIAVVPGKNYVIAFQSHDPRGRVRVSLTDGTEATVRAPSGAARFTSGPNRLLIDNQGTGATFEIGIPRSAPRLEIRVAEKPVFLKEGKRVVAPGSAGVAGKYLIDLSPPEN